MIFQLHDTHGRHLAITQIEADENVKRGWRTVTEAEFYETDLKTQYFEKFGKKPHYKMKDETIKKALDGEV